MIMIQFEQHNNSQKSTNQSYQECIQDFPIQQQQKPQQRHKQV